MCIDNNKTDNNIFNIGYGKNYSILEIYNTIAGLLNSDIKPIFKDNLEFEAQENLANISNAKSVGWEPHTNLTSGLKKSIDYIKLNVI